ncbi:dihydroorotate dehydrogenase [Tabrizicola sp.]|uniref:dihydroorotate dehydrogenase n=1 Tax=Tabrizicola sp. TaxID=2005166 RepID=UPI00286C4062|nr:dihydroorotate dehydrogenase [Tabrizicola sp.]
MRKTEMQDDDLTDLFVGLRHREPVPTAALMERVLANAVQAQQPVADLRVRAVRYPGLWSRIAGQFGGVTAVAGLCSAALIGLVIGYSDPTTVDYLTNGLSDDMPESMDMFPTADFLSTEG